MASSKIEQFDNNIITVKTQDGVSVHGSVRPTIPFPFRANDDKVGYVDARSLATRMREVLGLGKYKSLYTSHDLFVDEDGVSPMSSQLGYLCRIHMQGYAEVREEEIIYYPIQKVDFEYWCVPDNSTLSHPQMMKLLKDNKKEIFHKIYGYFELLDTKLVPNLSKMYCGKYPREIWNILDFVSVAKANNDPV